MIPPQEQNKNSRLGKKIMVVIGVLAVVAGVSFYYYRAIPHRAFGAGYSLTVPSGWRITQEVSSSVMVYPSASSCKFEISSFPVVSEKDRVAWIGGRLGADPTVIVAERSSEQVSVGGAPAIRWDGTMGGVPTVFVYAFATEHSYEIAPSVANGNDIASCEDILSELMANIRFSPEPQDAFNDAAMDEVAIVAATPDSEPTTTVATAIAATVSTGSVLGTSVVMANTSATFSNTNGAEIATDTDDGEDCL
jgi:hypothetical protein